MKVTIFDNGGITCDRYTVIIGRDVYGMSIYPTRANGFNQYCGDASDLNPDFVRDMGTSVLLKDLPAEVQVAIKDRMNPTY